MFLQQGPRRGPPLPVGCRARSVADCGCGMSRREMPAYSVGCFLANHETNLGASRCTFLRVLPTPMFCPPQVRYLPSSVNKQYLNYCIEEWVDDQRQIATLAGSDRMRKGTQFMEHSVTNISQVNGRSCRSFGEILRWSPRAYRNNQPFK